MLEGDFNAYFTLYAPKGYATAALSVMAPDVMLSVMHQDNTYDVEVDGSHLRIISARALADHKHVPEQMMHIAMILVEELDHRTIPSRAGNAEADQAKLVMYPFSGLRLRGRYVSWRWLWLGAFSALLPANLFILAAVVFFRGAYWYSVMLVVLAVLVAALYMKFVMQTDRQVQFRSNSK